MLNDAQLDQLALQLTTQYDFPGLLLQFQWNNEVMPQAWETREALTTVLLAEGPTAYLTRVHRWGFRNADIPESIRSQAIWPVVSQTLLTQWQEIADTPSHDAKTALVNVLALRGLGLARTTKWICFLDQSRYAIYDSRVSYALRRLLIDDRRIFPLVGGRVSNANRPHAVSADACVSVANVAAAAYVNYLLLVRRVARLVAMDSGDDTWCPGLVDCALFVAGQNRISDRYTGLPVNGAIN
jgi:hypothetical protein